MYGHKMYLALEIFIFKQASLLIHNGHLYTTAILTSPLGGRYRQVRLFIHMLLTHKYSHYNLQIIKSYITRLKTRFKQNNYFFKRRENMLIILKNHHTFKVRKSDST